MEREEKQIQMKMQRRQKKLTFALRISANLGNKTEFWINSKSAGSGVYELSQKTESRENPHYYKKKKSEYAAGLNPACCVHLHLQTYMKHVALCTLAVTSTTSNWRINITSCFFSVLKYSHMELIYIKCCLLTSVTSMTLMAASCPVLTCRPCREKQRRGEIRTR